MLQSPSVHPPVHPPGHPPAQSPCNAATVVPGTGAVPAALPERELQRLTALLDYDVLDTAAEQAYDDLTTLASAICGVPIALISLIDEERQWFKSKIGLDTPQTSRDMAFCSHAILQPEEVFEVPDAHRDVRFADNPLVVGGPQLRFYAGAPLLTPDGLPLGTICVLDRQPRALSEQQRRALASLARQVVAQLELRKTIAGLEQQSLSDGLTGVWNRRAFDRRLREEWSRHARSGEPLALLMVDIDHFKAFNDGFGHPAGDQALQQTAKALAQPLRTGDFLARYGGEEFVLLLPGVDDGAATAVAERLRAGLHAQTWPRRAVTASIGVASLLPREDGDRNALTARADQALYLAKQRGRDRVQCFERWDSAPKS